MNKIIMLGLLGLLIACNPKPETIGIRLDKYVGPVTEFGAMGGFSQKDTVSVNCIYPDLKGTPQGWSDIQYYYGTTDFPQALYQSFRQGVVDEEMCMSFFNAWGLDTASYSATPIKVFIAAAIGVNADKDTCVVFDNNGNLDLSDDMLMFYNAQHPVPVVYERRMNNQLVPDTTYVYTAFMFGQQFLKFAEYTTQTFQVKGNTYTIKTIPSGNDYDTFTWLELSTPDTTVLYHPKQFAQLGNDYYYIDSLSVDGRYIRLVETPDALSHEALQIGFRPYSFTTTTLTGDSIRFPDDFKNKYVLLDFWSTGCGPCVQEIDNTYPELYKRFKEAGFEILGVADNTTAQIQSFREIHPMSWQLVADRDQERKLQTLYQINHYPTLFLIDPNGRICADERTLRDSSLEKTLRDIYANVSSFESLNPEAFKNLLLDHPEIQLVDVRTPEEFAAGIIPHAQNIDVKQADFLSKAEAILDKSRPVAVYCRSGVRSRKAAYQLIDKGFKVYNLDKGYNSWVEAQKK